jgi:hypothetical protein
MIRYIFETAGGVEIGVSDAPCLGCDPATVGLGDVLTIGPALVDKTVTKITKNTYDSENNLTATEVTE